MDELSFYTPDPDLFGHNDAWRLYTTFASDLYEAGLADLFPGDREIRKIAIEILAERESHVENVLDDPSVIESAVRDAYAEWTKGQGV